MADRVNPNLQKLIVTLRAALHARIEV